MLARYREGVKACKRLGLATRGGAGKRGGGRTRTRWGPKKTGGEMEKQGGARLDSMSHMLQSAFQEVTLPRALRAGGPRQC